MSSEQAARLVFVAGMIEAGYVLIRASRGGLAEGKTYRSLWAIGLLTLGLAVFADFVPQVAGPFALLVLIAMIARNRDEVGGVLRGAHVGRAPARAPTSPQKVQPGTQSSSAAQRPETARGGN